jgi:hypothetical protein
MSATQILKQGQMVGPGRFTLIKELGRGGMGVVWLAQDTNLDEQVALKFLPSEVATDPVAVNDLRRETVRSHRLSHPNIIRIHDCHHQPDGVAFISMEYVDGQTLSGCRLQKPKQVLAWAALAPLVKQLCTALEYAHAEGVIHRDLKPANVMLDGRGRVKLADFGIAAVLSDSRSRASAKSSTGGTLAYMSPQQLLGKRPQIADDIYALGTTLYELLSSKPPFYSGDITYQVLHEPAAPLEERTLELGVDNPVPPEVAALVMACLAKEPEQRPQTAAAVAAWLGLVEQPTAPAEQFAVAMGGQECEACSTVPEALKVPASGLQAASWFKQRWAWVGGVAVCLLLMAALGMFWPKQNRQAGPSETNIADSSEKTAASSNTITPTTATPTTAVNTEEGFVPLFNGRDLSGWRITDKGAEKRCCNENCLIVNGSTDGQRGYDLYTEQHFKNFALRLEFKVPPGGNSGVYLRGRYEIQIADDAGDAKPSWLSSGAIYKNIAPSTVASRQAGEWQTIEATLAGSRVTVILNGITIIDNRFLGPPYQPPIPAVRTDDPGPIYLQGTRGAVCFRNIRIKVLQEAPGDQRWTNSLGMVFVPVPGTKVLFSIWESRVRDFAEFVKATGHDTGNEMRVVIGGSGGVRSGYNWRNPGFVQGPTHPVVGVNWDDTQTFCRWLTEKERREGRLKSDQRYRLPRDLEWSCAAGLENETGNTPRERHLCVKGKFFWGTQWPPPKGAGNFAGEEVRDADWGTNDPFIAGYHDGYPRTAPVGSFAPNRQGLYDLEGNVAEWCEDLFDNIGTARTSRWGTWHIAKPDFLNLSARAGLPPTTRAAATGFRVVLASGTTPE